MRAASLIVFGLLIISGCSKKPGEATPRAAVAPAPAVAAVPGLGDANLFDRMALELPKKDQADPPTSKVVAALTTAGITITQQAQHLGAPQSATYCLGLDAAEHLKMAVCEYTDEKAAIAGAEGSRKAFGAIENRTIHVHRSTTLTVVESPADQAASDAHRKALAAFEAL